MSTADSVSPPNAPSGRRTSQTARVPLGVSRYDQTAALLVSLLVIIGIFVLMLFIIWVTSRVWIRNEAVPVEFLEELSGRGDAAMGSARDLEEPGEEEVEDLSEPQLEDTLTAVTDIISSQQATLDSLEGEARSSVRGSGAGDSRQSGPGGDGNSNIIPRWERWEVQFESSTLADYADKLDFFKVELAAAGGGKPQIDYASNLTARSPDRRSGPADQEKRLYMTWRHGPLRAADKELLRRAGIDTEGRLIVQFYSPELENSLALLENKELAGRKLESVKKTVFSVFGESGNYEFRVIGLQTRFTRF